MKYLWTILVVLLLGTSASNADALAVEVFVFETTYLQTIAKDVGGIEKLYPRKDKEVGMKMFKGKHLQKYFTEHLVSDFTVGKTSCRLVAVLEKGHIVYSVTTIGKAPRLLSQGKITLNKTFETRTNWNQDSVVVIFRQGNFLKR
jgi:hypothetical protein